ncbi:MAG: cyclase family protein [candidate division NC10 bacterium]|nr:cyclase family protein [candidate division NC10 bacterium]
MRKALLVVAAIFVVSLFATTAFAYKILDLTHKFENGMPAWAGKWEGMTMWAGAKTQMECYDKVGNFYGYDLKFTEHTGTHMDSPSHNPYGFWTIDQIPMDKFHGKCVIMDMRPWVKDRDGYEVSLADIKAWEQKTGCNLARDSARSMIFMWTGWDKYWYDYIAGKNERFIKYGFPGITEDAAKYMADCRIKGFGMDVLSIDTYKRVVDEGKPLAHRAMFSNLVWVLENIKFDPSVADKWVYAVVAPMKIYQGSGAPTRVFVLDDTNAKGMAASLASMKELEKKFMAAPMYDLANDLRNGMHIWCAVFGGNLITPPVPSLTDFRGIYPWINYQYDGWYGQQLYTNEHFGTHTDAPAHRREGAQWTLDKIPLKNHAAPCLVVNASRYGPEEGDWIFDMSMFKDWMSKHPNLTVNKGDIVCFSQDMVHKWALHNNGIHREWVTYHFPGIGGDVAAYLRDKGVVGVLTDVTSIDAAMTCQRGKGTDQENNITHVTLLGNGIYITENVGGDLQQAANSKGFAFVMPCMLTKAGSGGHSRIWYFEGLDIPIE